MKIIKNKKRNRWKQNIIETFLKEDINILFFLMLLIIIIPSLEVVLVSDVFYELFSRFPSKFSFLFLSKIIWPISLLLMFLWLLLLLTKSFSYYCSSSISFIKYAFACFFANLLLDNGSMLLFWKEIPWKSSLKSFSNSSNSNSKISYRLLS